MWQTRIIYIITGLAASWSPQLVFLLFVALLAAMVGRQAVRLERNPIGYCFLATAIPLGWYGGAGLPSAWAWQYWAALPSGLTVLLVFRGLEWFELYRAGRCCRRMEEPDDGAGC